MSFRAQGNFEPSIIDLKIKRGTIEKWIISSSMLAGPFHIPGVSLQVVKENGNSPGSENLGWKDKMFVEDKIELLAKFDQPADERFPFMFHCHILEHADAGMIGQFSVR